MYVHVCVAALKPHPKPEALTLNPKPKTLNPKPYTLDPMATWRAHLGVGGKTSLFMLGLVFCMEFLGFRV